MSQFPQGRSHKATEEDQRRLAARRLPPRPSFAAPLVAVGWRWLHFGLRVDFCCSWLLRLLSTDTLLELLSQESESEACLLFSQCTRRDGVGQLLGQSVDVSPSFGQVLLQAGDVGVLSDEIILEALQSRLRCARVLVFQQLELIEQTTVLCGKLVMPIQESGECFDFTARTASCDWAAVAATSRCRSRAAKTAVSYTHLTLPTKA